MAEIFVTSTADSGSGSLRQAIADAANGDVILFDPVIFPAGQTTTIYLSSYLSVNKSIGIYGGVADGNGGYTSGATITRYVVRTVNDVETEVVVDDNHPALEGETVLFHVTTRVALDGQATQESNAADEWSGWTGVRCLSLITSANEVILSGITCQNGLTINSLYGGTFTILNQGSSQTSYLIKDCAFINGIRPQGGSGGVCVSIAEDSVARFSRCEFAEFKSYTTGGFYLYSGNTEIANSVFRDCYSGSNGACFYTNSNSTLNSCAFVDSKSNYSGAGLYITNGRNIVTSCVFGRLESDGNGGAVSCSGLCTNSFNDCSFKECSSPSGGAFYLAGFSKNTATNCEFKDCTSTGNGGGVRCESSSENELNDCIFDNCTCSGYGGAAYCNSNTKNRFNGCSFNSCSARSGGSAYVLGNSVNKFNSCDFNLSSSVTDGGTIAASVCSRNKFLGCNFNRGSSGLRGGGVIAISSSCNYFDDKCVFRDCTATSSGSGIYDMSLPMCDVETATFINCVYESSNPKEQRTTRYFTNTNDSGDGSLRDVIAACHNGDTIEPDPNVFLNGSVITISLSSALNINKRLYILGRGRRIVLDGQSATRIISVTATAYALIAKDVDIINGNEISALSITGSPGIIFIRSRYCGNHGQYFVYTSSTSGVNFIASLIAGNFTTYATDRNGYFGFYASTVAGNYLNGEAATFREAYTSNVNSITDTTYSTVGFNAAPPNSLAESDWNKDLWKTWNLSLTDESSYKSGAAALDEIDALVAGDGAKCDIEGCPRKPSGSLGAYEDRTGIQLVTTTADSGAGSLRSAIAAAQDGDAILFSYVTFPKGETTPILLNSYLSVSKSVDIYGGDWDADAEGYSSGATITRYVVREVEGVETEVVVDDDNPALEDEVVLMHVTTRVALDGQAVQDPDAADEWSGWTGTRVLQVNAVGSGSIINGLTLQNGLATTSETGALVHGNTQVADIIATFNDCAFLYGVNTVGTAGGVEVAGQWMFVLNNCEIRGCKAKQNAGGVFVKNDANIAMTDCVISDCSASSAAAIYSMGNVGATRTFTRCVVRNCNSPNNGGGMYCAGLVENILNGCTFVKCSAGNGGLVYMIGDTINTCTNCSFIDGSAVSIGGGVFLYNNTKTVISGCVFKDCHSVQIAGGFYSTMYANFALDDCTFTNCTASGLGGGAYFSGQTKGQFNNCVFEDCYGKNNGGGVGIFTFTDVDFYDCTFLRCSSNSGGGFYIGGASVANLTDCVFDECYIADTNNGGGGICTIACSRVTISGGLFNKCKTHTGGSGNGGGIKTFSLSHVVLCENEKGEKPVFRDCEAKSGSAISDSSIYPVNSDGGVYENCDYAAAYSVADRQTRYFTTTADSGDGSLRATINACNFGDTVEPDPTTFPKGSVINIKLSSSISIPTAIFLRGAGRRLELEAQGEIGVFNDNTTNRGLIASDVSFLNGARSGSYGSAIQTASIGVELTRCILAGNYGFRCISTSGSGGAILRSCKVVGNYLTGALWASMVVTVGTTTSGNYISGANSSAGSYKSIGSVVQPVPSEAGFRVAPPNSIAAEDWDKDLWKQWDLSLTSESSYATTTADDWEGADLWADGADWRYDTLGLPRKANGASGAYERYDFDYYQGDTATSFASPTGWYTDRLLTTPATAIADSASFYLDSAQTFSDAPSAGSSLAVGLNADVTIGATTATLQDVTAGINATLAATGDVTTTTLNASEGSDVSGFLPTTTLHLHDGAEYTVTQDSYTFPTLILDDSTTLTIPAGATIKATTLTIGDDVTIASSARAYFVPPVALDMSGVNWVNAKRTVYFTNTDNTGEGSLKAVVDAAQEGDFITPDPSIFSAGELVEVVRNEGLESTVGITLSAGETHLRLKRSNNSGDRIFYARTEASHFHAEDVEFIGRIIGYTPETILTRCRIYGNKSDAPGITGHAGSKITLYDCVVAGHRGKSVYNAGADSALTFVRSTLAGNSEPLYKGSSTVVTNVDSIVDPVCSEAGFVIPPPDTIAVPETGVAIDWSAWDLHLIPTSPYATGATSASGTTDVEGATRGVLDGGATRYAQGAYELADSDVHIVTSNADSGNGSLRAILAEVKNDDSIYFALANFPENQTTTITLNSELLVLGKDIEIIATENQDVVLSGNATVRPLTVCADYSYGAPRKSVTLRNLTITSGRANALTQSATTAISTLPSKQARKITRSQDCGGAIAVYGAGLTLDHCTITSSNATTSGGALYAAENAIVTATGTSFMSNVATTGDGGAVFITTDSSFVAGSGTNFYTNQAQLEGSAIASGRGTVTCNNVFFSSNTAVEGNSIVYLTGVGTFDNCLFGETTATGQYTLYVADDSEATVGTVGKTATDPDLAFKVEDSTLNVTASDYAEFGLAVTLANGTLNVQNTTAIPTLLFADESDSTVVIADDATLTTETITADGTATFSAETQAFLSVLPTTELDNLTFNNVVVGRVGADVTEVTAVKVGENYTIKINSTVNTIPVVVEYKGENDSEWTVAAPSFVGTTFQIRVPGDNLTFRVYDGEKHVTATVRTYGLYPPMRERTEVGYVN